ncbi:MAG: hypothetical protein M1832_001133 [Thelocarpon impressellum]|nr:MAG: hypothetical protein M1832_001133 [Thelocarpon impressellum]
MAAFTTAQNEAALDHFIRQPVSKDMVAHLARKASSVIRCEEVVSGLADADRNPRLPPTPPQTPPQDGPAPRFAAHETPLPSLEAFIGSLVDKSHVQVSTLMSSLVYLGRLQERLPPVAKGMRCTVHRIFLASLILAAKNLNDSSPKNKHWARYSCVAGYGGFGFSVTEVNLMEKQLLFLLDWDLRINQDDLLRDFDPFLAPIRAQQRRAQDEEDLARKVKLREREMARQQERELSSLQDLQRRHQHAVATYESYKQEFARSNQSSPALLLGPQHGRASSQQLSLSPPSSADVPELARSATVETLSSSSSIASSRGTPASSLSPYVDAADELLAGPTTGGGSPARFVHIRSVSQPLGRAHPLALDGFDEGKPVKKIKTGASIFSRFLGSAGADRYGGLGTRARPQFV